MCFNRGNTECDSSCGFQGTLLSPQRKPAHALFSCFCRCSPTARPEESDAELELQSVPCLENTLLLVPNSLHLPVNPLSAPHTQHVSTLCQENIQAMHSPCSPLSRSWGYATTTWLYGSSRRHPINKEHLSTLCHCLSPQVTCPLTH